MIKKINTVHVCDTTIVNFSGKANKVFCDPQKYPHSLLVGRTGSGKSYAARTWIYNFIQANPDTQLMMLDFKREFPFLPSTHYYSGENCYIGLQNFYNEMLERQKACFTYKPPYLLYIDELAVLVNALDKKQSELFKRMLSTIYMVSRAQNMFTISSLQRADASTWIAGARDNIGFVVLLGDLSKESCEMFSLDKSRLRDCPQAGMGHVLVNGSPSSLTSIHIPQIKNISKLDSALRKALN